MKGTLQRTIPESHLSCQTCIYFRNDDPDIFYCLREREEFPSLCNDYCSREKIADLKNKWNIS
jgi:hypothetical protein